MISVMHQLNGTQPNPTNKNDKNKTLLHTVTAME